MLQWDTCVFFNFGFLEGNGTPLQYSCLENLMDGGAWCTAVHGVTKSYDWATSLSLFTFMHWRRKWQPTPVFLPGEAQGWGSLVGCIVQSVGSHRVGHDWSDLAAAAVSLLVIGLFTLSIFPGSLLGDCTYLRICLFLLSCPFYWHMMNRRFSNK